MPAAGFLASVAPSLRAVRAEQPTCRAIVRQEQPRARSVVILDVSTIAFGRPSQALALRPRVSQPRLDTFDDQTASQFGNGRQDGENHLSHWRGRVHLLIQAYNSTPSLCVWAKSRALKNGPRFRTAIDSGASIGVVRESTDG